MTTKNEEVTKEKLFTRSEVEVLVNQAIAFAMKQGIPTHQHTCQEGHKWFCTSPYCEDVNLVPRACMDHGGVLPIEKGFEPWRGGAR